jgi:hypothetical protein
MAEDSEFAVTGKELNIYGILAMVHNSQNHLVYGLVPSSGILDN